LEKRQFDFELLHGTKLYRSRGIYNVLPSPVNVTVPGGVPPSESAGEAPRLSISGKPPVTVAVEVTDWPYVDGFSDDLEHPDPGGVSFDPTCGSALIWTYDGRVLRYTKKLKIFDLPCPIPFFWHRPGSGCEN
jgi:hypothetical protein